jgi:peptidoglycan/LPS O-acetylase OafA/YrhL
MGRNRVAALAVLWFAGAYKRPVIILGMLVSAVLIVWWNGSIDPRHKIILFLPITFLTGNLMYLYRDSLTKVDPFLPLVTFFVALNWRQLQDAHLLGEAPIPLVQGFVIVWIGMAGKQILPMRIPDVSYGLYVYHWPVLEFLKYILHINDLFWLISCSVAVLIPLTLASWYFIEQPALRLKRRLRPRGSCTGSRYYSANARSPEPSR